MKVTTLKKIPASMGDKLTSGEFASLRNMVFVGDEAKPQRSFEIDEGGTFNTINDYYYHNSDTAAYAKVWGLGKNGSNYIQFNSKDITGNWTTTAGAYAGGTGVGYGLISLGDNLFTHCAARTAIVRYTMSTGVYSDVSTAVGTPTAPPVYHPNLDAVFFFTTNGVYKLDSSYTLTLANLVIPDTHKITTASVYGNYLAIGMSPKAYGNAQVFLWNMDTDLVEYTQLINFGKGKLKAIGEPGGILMGIVETSETGTSFKDGISIKQYIGGTHVQEVRFIPSTLSNITLGSRPRFDGEKIYVDGRIEDGLTLTNHYGIFSLDRFGRFILEVDCSDIADYPDGYIYVDGYWHIADGGNLYRTNDQFTFTTSSTIETGIFDDGDPTETKKLIGITVFYDKNADAGGTGLITVKIREFNATSWTTVGTVTCDSSRRQSFINISGSTNFPEFKELIIRTESTVGAYVKQIKIATEKIKDDIYG